MADLSNFYSDGAIKWGGKQNAQSNNIPVQLPPAQNIISGLIATDIKTDLQNVTIKIVKLNTVVGQISIPGYVSTDINGNQITVYSSDELPLVLEFTNSTEALAADTRLTLCINGGVVL